MLGDGCHLTLSISFQSIIYSFIDLISQNTGYKHHSMKNKRTEVFHRTERPMALTTAHIGLHASCQSNGLTLDTAGDAKCWACEARPFQVE